MSAPADKQVLIDYWTIKCKQMLQDRNNLDEDDRIYVVEKTASLKDERLKNCIVELVGWGTDDRAALETFCAIALEVMADSTPSRLREAARRVEMRYLNREVT